MTPSPTPGEPLMQALPSAARSRQAKPGAVRLYQRHQLRHHLLLHVLWSPMFAMSPASRLLRPVTREESTTGLASGCSNSTHSRLLRKEKTSRWHRSPHTTIHLCQSIEMLLLIAVTFGALKPQFCHRG